MTIQEAAARLGLHKSTVYQLVALGELEARRIGPKRGKIVVDEAAVERYWAGSLLARPKAERSDLVRRHLGR